MDKLPSSMTILGGGPIGIEMAQAFSRLGSRVTVVDMSSQILGKEDKDLADDVMAVLEGEGVIFHLNATVVRVREEAARKVVVIKAEGCRTGTVFRSDPGGHWTDRQCQRTGVRGHRCGL